MLYSVYVLTNTVNGKCYVGSCQDNIIRKRKSAHLTGTSNPLISDDLDKFDCQAFHFMVFRSGLTKFEARSIEKWLIQQVFHSHEPFGYNICPNGDGYGHAGENHYLYGKTRSPESIAKQSAATKGKRRSIATEFKKGHSPSHKTSIQKQDHIRYLYRNGIRASRMIASIVQVSKTTVLEYTKDLR